MTHDERCSCVYCQQARLPIPTSSPAAVCRQLALYGRRCESATNGRLCTACTPAAACDCGIEKWAPGSTHAADCASRAPAAVGDEIERLAREACEVVAQCDFDTLEPYEAKAWLAVARLVQRKVLEARKVLLLRIPYMAATQQHVDHLEDWEQTELAAIAAELAALEEPMTSEPSTAQDTND